MKISLDTLSGFFGPGQKVQGEVVGSGEGGSQVVLNGIPARTDKRLPVGQRIEGTIDQVQGDKATVTLSTTGEPAVLAENWLAKNGLPADQINQALIKAFQTYRFPITPDLLQKARELFDALGLTGDPQEYQTLALLLMRKLPTSAFALLKKYVGGELRFGQLFSRLSPEARAQVMAEWTMGKFLERLGDFLKGSDHPGFQPAAREGLTEEVLQNLVFQESLSSISQPDQEGHFYFQWPMFWQHSDVPDTLEGEAYFAHSDQKEPGFSLRLLVSPPQLGPMEVGLHRVQQSLWVHFGTERAESRPPLQELFPVLSEALKQLGWGLVKLTVGQKSLRTHFLSPARPESSPDPEPLLDVRG